MKSNGSAWTNERARGCFGGSKPGEKKTILKSGSRKTVTAKPVPSKELSVWKFFSRTIARYVRQQIIEAKL